MKTTYGTMYYVDQMNEAVEFYKKTLGLTPTYSSDFWTEFSLGEHRLCLHAKHPDEKYDANGVMIISYDGVNQLFETMKKDGYNVFGLHEVHPGHSSFHFKDNHNNELSFFGKN